MKNIVTPLSIVSDPIDFRQYGFLHPNSKRIIRLVQLVLKFNPLKWQPKKKVRKAIKCRGCGGLMHIVKTRIKRDFINPVPT